jgi:hypothetical protein
MNNFILNIYNRKISLLFSVALSLKDKLFFEISFLPIEYNTHVDIISEITKFV